MKKLLFALFALLLTMAPARAQPARAEVSALVARILAAEQQAAAAAGLSLSMNGAPEIVPDAGLYQVTLPHLVLSAADGGRLDLGRPVAALAADDHGSWRIGLIFKTPLRYVAADGSSDTTIDAGRQTITLTWRDDFHGFTAVNAHCADVLLSGATGSSRQAWSGMVPDLSFQYGLQPSADIWRGPFALQAGPSNFTLGKSSLRLGGLSVRGQADVIAGVAQAGIAHLSATADLSALHVHNSASAGAGRPAQDLNLPQASVALDLRNNKSGADDDAKLDAHYAGLTVNPVESAATLPAHLDLSAHIAPLPLRGLAALGHAFLISLTDGTKDEQKAARAALLHLLEAAHSKVTLNSLSLGNDIYSAQGSGAATMSETAPNGAVGTATATAKGLSRLVQTLDGRPPAAMVTVLQLIGQQAAGDTRTYTIELKPDGPVLFNGQDIQPLLQGAAALSQFGVKIQ